jgi:hypothetical protein
MKQNALEQLKFVLQNSAQTIPNDKSFKNFDPLSLNVVISTIKTLIVLVEDLMPDQKRYDRILELKAQYEILCEIYDADEKTPLKNKIQPLLDNILDEINEINKFKK